MKAKPKKAESKQLSEFFSLSAAQKRNAWIIAGLAFLLYFNTLSNDYVLDDFSVIKENWVTKKGLEGVPIHWQNSYRYGYWNEQGSLYRPLSLMMFAVEWHFFPESPFIGHLVNILNYAVLAWLLYYTMLLFFRKTHGWLPLMATLLFVFHPIHTEVVANIKSRDELLSITFVLLSTICLYKYFEKSSIKYLFFALVSYLLGFLSKEGVVTMLAVFPLLFLMFSDFDKKKIIFSSILMVIPLFVYLGIRKSVLGDIKGLDATDLIDNMLVVVPDGYSKFATAVVILGKYLWLLLVPHPLVCDYSLNEIDYATFADWRFLISFFSYGAAIVLAYMWRKKHPIVTFSVLFFIITMSLYSNLVIIIGTHLGERLVFWSSLSFAILSGYGLLKLFKVESSDADFKSLLSSKGVAAVLSLVLVLYSVKTISRNKDWYNDYTLYTNDVKLSSKSARTHYYHALQIVKEEALKAATPEEHNKLTEKAILEYETATDIYPNYADAYDQLGLAYFRLGKMEQAVENYNKCLAINPTKATAYSNLGAIYFNSQQYDKCIEVYKRALLYNPRYSDAYLNLGSTLGTIGKPDEAIEAFKNCLLYEPNHALAHYYIGITYQNTNRPNEAKPYLEKAYQLNPALKK